MWTRVGALVLRHLYLYRRSLTRAGEVVFWPVMELLLWGFLTRYLEEIEVGATVSYLVGAVILWDVLYRSQQAGEGVPQPAGHGVAGSGAGASCRSGRAASRAGTRVRAAARRQPTTRDREEGAEPAAPLRRPLRGRHDEPAGGSYRHLVLRRT